MNKISDVIVIGAGVVGCSAAYYLSKRGIKVTVLERREIGLRRFGKKRKRSPAVGTRQPGASSGDVRGAEYLANAGR